jgi:hypothetical protein
LLKTTTCELLIRSSRVDFDSKSFNGGMIEMVFNNKGRERHK